MKKLSKIFLSFIILISGFFSTALEAKADMITTSFIIPGAPMLIDGLIVLGLLAGVIVLISWLIIRGIRAIIKKKNDTNK